MIEIRSLRDLLRLYFIHQREFKWTFAITVVVVMLVGLLMPPRFSSEARLLVKPGRENMVVPLEMGDRPAVYPQVSNRDPMIDEEKMLTGRSVLNQVVRTHLADLKNAKPPEGVFQRLKASLKSVRQSVSSALSSALEAVGLKDPRSEEDALSERLAARFSVSHGSGSNVMDIAFTWDDPESARRILSTWLRVYMDERTSVLGRKSLVTFYEGKVLGADAQMNALKAQLQVAMSKIEDGGAPQRLEAIISRLTTLENRLSDIRGEQAALENSLHFTALRMETLPKDVVTERELGQSVAHQGLSTQLAELKRQRVDALRVFKDTSPAIVSMNESIASLEVLLAAEAKPVERTVRRVPSEVALGLQRSVIEKGTRIAELKGLQANGAKEVAELQALRTKVLANEPEITRLEQEKSSLEKSRALYLDSLERARTDQSLDDSRINNVAPVQQPTLNASSIAPHGITLISMALVAALLAGLVVVYLRTLADQRIHDAGRLEQRFGTPVWTSVKDISVSGVDNEFLSSLYRILGTLPLQDIAAKGVVLGLTAARAGEGTSFLATHLRKTLESQGMTVRIDPTGPIVRTPGELTVLSAAGLNTNPEVFVTLGRADLIVLVVQARSSTVAQVDNAITALRTAFRRVDGIIFNRRQFEVPAKVIRWLQS